MSKTQTTDDPLPSSTATSSSTVHSSPEIPNPPLPLVVVNSTKQFPFKLKNVTVISARTYVSSPAYAQARKATVYNLCSSYRYQKWGYYVSLLADARGHRVFPSASATQDFKSPTIIKSISEELEELFQTALRKVKDDKFELYIYFSQSLNPAYEKLAKELHDLFQAPMLRATFVKEDGLWELQNISPVAIGTVPDADVPMLQKLAQEYFGKTRLAKRTINRPYFDLAILIDPKEVEPPSNRAALRKFIKVGASMNINVELITKEDYARIPEYDALFIRTTTSVDHYTYRFARYAQTEGLAVIDDPASIVKCTNKVYLAELLGKAHISTPATFLVHGGNYEELAKTIEFPCVLKTPDGSSSMGVAKANNAQEFMSKVKQWLEGSDLLIAQKFMPSEFDWRVGVLDGKFYFACKYYMAPNHWQIYKWGTQHHTWGRVASLSESEVPPKVLQTALRATKQIGDGLYGVDLKQIGDEVYVIEVNDNPNLENRFEDTFLKDELYAILLRSFAKRVAALNASKDVAI